MKSNIASSHSLSLSFQMFLRRFRLIACKPRLRLSLATPKLQHLNKKFGFGTLTASHANTTYLAYEKACKTDLNRYYDWALWSVSMRDYNGAVLCMFLARTHNELLYEKGDKFHLLLRALNSGIMYAKGQPGYEKARTKFNEALLLAQRKEDAWVRQDIDFVQIAQDWLHYIDLCHKTSILKWSNSDVALYVKLLGQVTSHMSGKSIDEQYKTPPRWEEYSRRIRELGWTGKDLVNHVWSGDHQFEKIFQNRFENVPDHVLLSDSVKLLCGKL
jgi:hypothetical protein